VEAQRLHCPAEPVRIALTDSAGRFEVEVTDTGGAGGDRGVTADGIAAAVTEPGGSPRLEHGLGLAMIAGLADDVQISESPGGVSIRMSWPAAGLGR
jgi:anti-sigma regulatory factor (Ser/Thr protein kinase)